MNDLIYREDAIKAACKGLCHPGLFCPDTGCKELDPIKNLPAAERWIPCSERLPDLWDERYLVSLAWGGVGTMEYKSTGFHNYGSFSPVPIETVIAWMPLPEPYKREQDEG